MQFNLILILLLNQSVCFQNNHNGGNKIYIGNNGAYFGKQGTDIITFKLSQNGHQLLGSTYIGGSGNDGLNYNYSGEMLEYNNISIKPGLFPEITKETFCPKISLAV